MRQRNTTNINSELRAIGGEIEYIEKLEYSESFDVHCGGGHPVLLSSLDKDDFYRVKEKILKLMKECYNKKSDEMIAFCQQNKMAI